MYKAGLIFISCLIACAALYVTRWIVIVLLMGLGFGVLLSPIISGLTAKFKIPHGVSVVVTLVMVLGAIAGFIYFSFHLILDQFSVIAENLPKFVQSLQSRIIEISKTHPSLGRLNESMRAGGNVSSTVSQGITTAFKALASSATILGGFFFVLATAFYLAVAPEKYMAAFLSAFPASKRSKTETVMRECAIALRNWFSSQLIAMLIVGVLVSVGLKIIGSDSWLVLGIITAIFESVSVFGPLAAFITATIVTLASQPEKLYWVMALYFLVLRLEGDLIIPLLMRSRIRLPPIHLLTLMLILGDWFGVVGFFVAAPVLAVARTIYMMVYVPIMNKNVASLD